MASHPSRVERESDVIDEDGRDDTSGHAPDGEGHVPIKIDSLRDTFIHELKDLYSAEMQLTKALPKMAKAAANEQLSAGFEEHLH